MANAVLQFPSLRQVVSVSAKRKQVHGCFDRRDLLIEPKERLAWP